MKGRPGTRDEADLGARPLKLRAHDAEDLQAIAACLQDALVPLSDVAYLKPEKRFVMVANRFRWEGAATQGPAAARPEPGSPGDARFEAAGKDRPARFFERVNCGVCFDRVTKVRVRGVDLRDREQILNLLTLGAAPGAITLVFSGGAEIRLEVSQIRCHMEDLGEPWPTPWRPSHPLEDPAADGRR
ncbi:MAG: DUF2948 family protein [Alphaproteobacteria bacterium]